MNDNTLVRIYNRLDGFLKFPNPKDDEIGIHVGYYFSSNNLTTDAIKMHTRTQRKGLIIAVDPDPVNHENLTQLITSKNLSIKTIQKGTYSHKTNEKLVLGTLSIYNKLESTKGDPSPSYTDQYLEIDLDTLDNIIAELNIDYSKIRHIFISNNAAEYPNILDMEDIPVKCKNLYLTVISGCPYQLGKTTNRPYSEVVNDHITKKGFNCKHINMKNSFWWGFVYKLLIKRTWKHTKETIGIIMANFGGHKLKFQQSFS